MSGIELWRGNSWIDGAPIVAIATIGSGNRKTGDMVQSWILRSDIDPIEAYRSDEDASICGNCVHRGSRADGISRTCYVNIGQAPQSIFRAFKRGIYPRADRRGVSLALFGRAVRLGSYGDPALLPASLLRAMTVGARIHTGYTHQWRDARADHAREFCMASCDTLADVAEARARGWRTFYVGVAVPTGSVECPASAEYFARTSRKVTCADCGLCGGLTRGGLQLAPNVAPIIRISPHGASARIARARSVELTIGAST